MKFKQLGAVGIMVGLLFAGTAAHALMMESTPAPTPSDSVGLDRAGWDAFGTELVAGDPEPDLMVASVPSLVPSLLIDDSALVSASSDGASGADTDVLGITGPGVRYDEAAAAPVPEPASMALLAFGMGGIGVALRKRRKQ